MKIENLVAAVNAARAREDYIYFKSLEFQQGIKPENTIRFLFEGHIFQTELPYRIRVTQGVVLLELNRGCYLMEDANLIKVTFHTDESGEVYWKS